MSITIQLGKSGRLVVPKVIRDSLGLHEGSRLKLEIHGGKLEVAPQSDPIKIEIKNGLPVIQSGKPLNRGSIVQAIKADRDARDEKNTSAATRK